MHTVPSFITSSRQQTSRHRAWFPCLGYKQQISVTAMQTNMYVVNIRKITTCEWGKWKPHEEVRHYRIPKQTKNWKTK